MIKKKKKISAPSGGVWTHDLKHVSKTSTPESTRCPEISLKFIKSEKPGELLLASGVGYVT